MLDGVGGRSFLVVSIGMFVGKAYPFIRHLARNRAISFPLPGTLAASCRRNATRSMSLRAPVQVLGAENMEGEVRTSSDSS